MVILGWQPPSCEVPKPLGRRLHRAAVFQITVVRGNQVEKQCRKVIWEFRYHEDTFSLSIITPKMICPNILPSVV